MNIISATESAIKSRMDEHAFEINATIQNQDAEGSMQRLIKAISNYERASSQFEVLQKIKEQLSQSPPEPEKKDEN